MNKQDILSSTNNIEEAQVDPDPFGIAFALLGAMFAGGCYLESRRSRQYLERQAKDDFRKKWFQAKRTLIHAERVTEEFATHVQEEGFGGEDFIFGKIQLTIDQEKAQQLRRLHGNAQTTAMHMADDLDDLSTYLSSEYNEQIEAIRGKLKEQGLPHSYDAVIILARDAIALYRQLLEKVGEKEEFS